MLFVCLVLNGIHATVADFDEVFVQDLVVVVGFMEALLDKY